jgi:hypothetical protein
VLIPLAEYAELLSSKGAQFEATLINRLIEVCKSTTTTASGRTRKRAQPCQNHRPTARCHPIKHQPSKRRNLLLINTNSGVKVKIPEPLE